VSVSDEQAWEERYRSRPAVWSRQPNPQLVTEAAGLAPGQALDAGCGEGADAIWLASQGWQVTAVDFSATALERGAAQAQAAGMADSVRWVRADLTAQAPDEQSYDLVSAQFMQLPPQPRRTLFAALAAAVAPGGTLLIVGQHPSDLATTVHRPPLREVFYTADELTADLDALWDVEVAEMRPRAVTDSEGREVTIHDTVLRARRRPA